MDRTVASKPHHPSPPPGRGGGHPPHGHPPRRPPRKKNRHGVLLTGLAASVVLAGLAAWLWRPSGGGDPSERLLEQMHAAALGPAPPVHAFGGTLTVNRTNNRLNVVADKVPSRACVQVGWRLAREGTIIVDGIMPARLSAGKLAELCAGEAATLTWIPDE